MSATDVDQATGGVAYTDIGERFEVLLEATSSPHDGAGLLCATAVGERQGIGLSRTSGSTMQRRRFGREGLEDIT